MRLAGVRGKGKRRQRVQKPHSQHSLLVAKNLRNHEFAATQPNHSIWIAKLGSWHPQRATPVCPNQLPFFSVAQRKQGKRYRDLTAYMIRWYFLTCLPELAQVECSLDFMLQQQPHHYNHLAQLTSRTVVAAPPLAFR